MYCQNCGREIADGAKFCSYCGNPAEAIPQTTIPVGQMKQEMNRGISTEMGNASRDAQQGISTTEKKEEARKPLFEEFSWNVSDYPDRDAADKTEDINFNWNADPAEIPDTPVKAVSSGEDTSSVNLHTTSETPGETLKGTDLENAIFGQTKPQQTQKNLSAAERIDKFYTFNRKNEEFQQLLNNEYHKVKSGNAIEAELSQAERLANERFESRTADPSMEAFFEKEGIVKPYQPKEFESDVLHKIELQEKEREAKRLEEEVRLAAIEQARLEAEAKKRTQEEAARLEAIKEQQIREQARAAEEAKLKAQEVARLKAQEEARLKAQEEMRLRAEQEARLKAEEEAKAKATEAARIKAESDLRAAQEAAKIRAQQEARLAAEAEEQFRLQQEKKRLEALEAQRRLEEERAKLSKEANQAVAQEEMRKALEQTSRMRKEEEEKIRAAVAGIRAGSVSENAGSNVSPLRKDVEEAHQATKNQINEMAKARDAYFAEMEQPKAEPIKAEQPQAERPVTGRDTLLSSTDLGITRIVDKEAILAGLEDATRVVSKEPIRATAGTEPTATGAVDAQPMDFRTAKDSADDIDDLLSQFESVNNIAEQPETLEFEENSILADDHMKNGALDENPGLNDTIVMPHNSKLDEAPANDFDSYGNEEAANYLNQQNQQQGRDVQQAAMDDFYEDNFSDEPQISKKEQKERDKEQRRIEKEKAKENKAQSKSRKKGDNADNDAAKADDGNGGKGRIALKVILIILIVILAVEVIGMGIRFLAPQSKAAEFIDTQLNNVVQLITGDDTEYSFASAQARTTASEDKTDFINTQKDKNSNDNIKEIVYSSDLGYDQERDGKVSDLVLSQPMTQVEWGRDEDNYPVYYDTEVVGEIIAFESRKMDLMNKGYEKVLGMIDKDSKLYKKISKLKNKKSDGEFAKLEIGEIRQAGSNYYIWVRETIGGETVEKVYSMYPEKKFVMKILASYEV